MSPFVQPAFIAYDFPWVKCRSAPRGWFGGMAVEAPPSKILCLLRCCVVCVLHRKRGMRRRGVVVWVGGVVGRNDDG